MPIENCEVMENKIAYITSKGQIMFKEIIVFKILVPDVNNFALSLIDKNELEGPNKSQQISSIYQKQLKLSGYGEENQIYHIE